MKYNNGDKEDMTISDIRKCLVEKEKVNKKSSTRIVTEDREQRKSTQIHL